METSVLRTLSLRSVDSCAVIFKPLLWGHTFLKPFLPPQRIYGLSNISFSASRELNGVNLGSLEHSSIVSLCWTTGRSSVTQFQLEKFWIFTSFIVSACCHSVTSEQGFGDSLCLLGQRWSLLSSGNPYSLHTLCSSHHITLLSFFYATGGNRINILINLVPTWRIKYT